jgi:nucleoside-diphosphate-sugar epimerase
MRRLNEVRPENVNKTPKLNHGRSTQFTVMGASGFIGGNLVRYLRSLGHSVSVPGRDDAQLYGQSLGHLIYAIGVTADFRTRSFDTMEAHVSVLSKILRHGTYQSFTYLSSTRVYKGGGSTDETTDILINPANPSDLYNLSKLAGEALCLAQPSDVIRIARLSNVYGSHVPDTAADTQNFLASIIYDALSKRRVVLRTALDSAKDYVAVDDVCRALAQIAVNGTERLYNIAAGQNISHAQLAQALTASTGCSVEVAPRAPKIEYPTIDTTRLSNFFTNIGEDWSPASLLDQLSHLTAAPQLEPTIAAGGMT